MKKGYFDIIIGIIEILFFIILAVAMALDAFGVKNIEYDNYTFILLLLIYLKIKE